MINPEILRALADYQETFVTAEPFKHVCIDNFFETDCAEKALRDFPSFDPQKAVNELGNVGKKAVNTEIAGISDFYRQLDAYLKSEDFLNNVSKLTGIPDLLSDPDLYGGGTHENLHGQELDPHVDFNYDSKTGYHRRLNLLLYLNKDWYSEWGGSIELHSNPRDPQTNKIHSYLPLFNRAVLFETNEYSWHGFPPIALPDDKHSLSRKCLSIYLYTKDRPADEIAPTHGTFYVQRPLPERFQSGYILKNSDISDLKGLLRKRDVWIESYQRKELDHSAQLEMHRSKVRVPLQGYVKNDVPAIDYYFDNWAGPNFSVVLSPQKPVSKFVIAGYIPETFPTVTLEAAIDGAQASQLVPGKEGFQWEFAAPSELKSEFQLSITSGASYCGAEQGINSDVRKLVFLLNDLIVIHPAK